VAKSVREIVTDAQELIGEVPGAGAQTYGDDRMFRDCIRVFNMFHKKYPWEQYTSWTECALDGATGKITVDAFQQLKDFEDILAVFPNKSNFQIPILDRRRNPLSLTGSAGLFWTSLPTTDPDYQFKRLKIIPPSATSSIVVFWRHYPRTFDTSGKMSGWRWDDVMDLDEDMLTHATAWMTLSSDDINSNAAQDQQNLADDRFQEITAALARRKMTPSPSGASIPNQWYVSNIYGLT
jgi:hypothetical protein